MLNMAGIFSQRVVFAGMKGKGAYGRGDRYGLINESPYAEITKRSEWASIALGTERSELPFYASWVEGSGNDNLLASPKMGWKQYLRFLPVGEEKWPVNKYFGDGKEIPKEEAKKWMVKDGSKMLSHIFTKLENVLSLSYDGDDRILPDFRNLVVADTETTGIEQDAEVISFGASSPEGEKVGEIYMNPVDKVVHPGAAETNKYSPEEWKKRNAVGMKEGLSQAFAILDGHDVVFHNAAFDWPRLQKQFMKYLGKIPKVKGIWCTLHQSRVLGFTKNSLADCCLRYGIINDEAHGALSDAIATSKVLKALLAETA